MTHDDLVARARVWLRRANCGVVFNEMVTAQQEQPDSIGWKDSARKSFMIECKTSRADFFADAKKPHRAGPGLGMYRYFMCEPNIIKVEDLPPKWGLLWCYPKKVQLMAGRDPRRYCHADADEWLHGTNDRNEMCMLYSALIRLRLDLGDRDFHDRVHMSFEKRNAKAKEGA